MKKLVFFAFLAIATGITLFQSCTDDPDKPIFPLSAEIFHSVKAKQVAFNALTHSATSWSWDFGDGKTSTEQNPVHVYEVGGYYKAKLTATDLAGNSVTKEVSLAVALTPYALLTGDHTAEGYKGKTWKLTTNHTTNTDYLANCDAALTTAKGTPKPLPNGIFSQLGMPEAYKDEFTFFHDGSYVHNTANNNGLSFSALLHQVVLNGGADVTNLGGKDYGLCIAKYTPQTGAKFTYVEKEDLTISSVYGAGGKLTFKDVSTLDFTGTEFIGFRDAQRKIILNKISDNSMQLIMFMAGAPQAYPANTNALILSFEVVK
jgi:PKD repeat protein